MYGIEIKDLTVKLGDFKLKNVNLVIPKGTILGLVGRNGAGKTTLIKSITHCHPIKNGAILINGNTKEDDELTYIKELGVAYDELSTNKYLKPKNIIKVLERNFDKFDKQFLLKNFERFNIDINKRLDRNSLGTNKKYSIILALSLNPKVLVLDEPTSGIDPADKKEIIELLQTFMQDQEHTILYSTHIISDLEKIADYIALIDDGDIKFIKEKDALIEDMYLVQIKEDQLNNDISNAMIHLKQDSFGIEGLTNNRLMIDKYNLKFVKPSIENILIKYMDLYKGEEKK
jgi:ABC-2 type transport system ATP-binding protein